MTKKGSTQRPWTDEEIEQLRDMAGRLSVQAIAEALGRSYWAVAHAAERLGISTRCYRARLVWCRTCASWRSSIDQTGKCRVCRMSEQLAGREAACAEVYARMPAEIRAVYAKSEAQRGTKSSSLRPRPKMRESCPVSRYERDKAQADYLLALEEWEYRRLKLPYDAAKKRLQRMREALGENPRKSKRRVDVLCK